MTMLFRFLLVTFLFTNLTFIMFSQDNKLSFTYFKPYEESGKVVYFNIKGLDANEDERTQVQTSLANIKNVSTVRIYTSSLGKTMCQMYMTDDIKPEIILEVLKQYNYDFDYTTVAVNGVLKDRYKPETYTSNKTNINKKHAIPHSTDLSDSQYQDSKAQWIEQNQKVYNKELNRGTAKFPIIISKQSFNSFTPEKQQRILSQPKKYKVK